MRLFQYLQRYHFHFLLRLHHLQYIHYFDSKCYYCCHCGYYHHCGRSEAEAGALKRRRRFFQKKVLAFLRSNEKNALSRAQAFISSKPKVRFSLKQE